MAEDVRAIVAEIRTHLQTVTGSSEMNELAERCGVARSTLYNIANGRSVPKLEMAAAILREFKRQLGVKVLDEGA